MQSARRLLVLLLAASATGKGRGHKRALRQGGKGDGLGKTTPATGPLHRTVCDDGKPCRPGEGNLKGYEHWKMPWEPPSIDGLTKQAPHGWSNGAPFPTAPYAQLVSAAKRVASNGNAVVFAAADFDFRELGENWLKSTQRAGIGNALLYALDTEAYDYFLSKFSATTAIVNGTDNLNAWEATRLQRHIQRALAERHMAAAALVHAGFDVLLTDATHVFVRNPFPDLLRQRKDVDLWAMRGGCNAKKPENSEAGLGCGLMWNFVFFRGASMADQSPMARQRLVSFIQSAVDTGMVDFYLRWWAGHHCIFMGYVKMIRNGHARLEGGLTPRENALKPNGTAVVELTHGPKRWCDSKPCLRIGMLPHDRYPPPGQFPDARQTAFVGRAVRPDVDPKRSHRLRLDRYDNQDFDDLVAAMKAQSLWLL